MKLFGREVEINNHEYGKNYIFCTIKIANQEFTHLQYIYENDLKIDHKLPLENQLSEYIKNSALNSLQENIEKCASGNYVNYCKKELERALQRQDAAKWLIDGFNNKR